MGKITRIEWFGSETTKVWRQKELSMRGGGGGGGGRGVGKTYLKMLPVITFSVRVFIYKYTLLSFFLFSVYIQ